MRSCLVTGAALACFAGCLAGCLAGCGGGGVGGGVGGGASCAGPQLSVSPTQARPGDQVTVSVEWLHEGCDDTGGPSDERPATATVVFVQGAEETALGTVAGAGETYAATLTAVVPAGATPGVSTVGLGDGWGVGTDVTVLP